MSIAARSAAAMNAMRLPTPRRRTVYAAALALWLSGAGWLVAHYAFPAAGPLGPEPSPAEPWALKLHGAAAMWTLWVLGLLWAVHIVRGWRARRGRSTGGLLLCALALMTLTGWLLYYWGSEDWRPRVSALHWALGLAALPLFLWHRFARKPACA